MTETTTVEELERDPYPVYARLRREAPVAWMPAVGLWFVTRWQDLVDAAEDPVRFPAALPGSPLDRTCGGPTVLTVDGAAQTRWREPMERTLDRGRSSRRLPRWWRTSRCGCWTTSSRAAKRI